MNVGSKRAIGADSGSVGRQRTAPWTYALRRSECVVWTRRFWFYCLVLLQLASIANSLNSDGLSTDPRSNEEPFTNDVSNRLSQRTICDPYRTGASKLKRTSSRGTTNSWFKAVSRSTDTATRSFWCSVLTVGPDCQLERSIASGMLDEPSRSWRIDEAALNDTGNDIQSLIQCTLEGDTLLFNMGQPIQLDVPIEISGDLTLGTFQSSTASRQASETPEQTVFRCPPMEGAFFVKSGNVSFRDIAFHNCTLAFSTSGAILEVESCGADDAPHTLSLQNVAFVANLLVGAAAISAHDASCFSVAMNDVIFENNTCSGVCLADLPINSHAMSNLKMLGNMPAETTTGDNALIRLPFGSLVRAERLLVQSNGVTAIQIDGGELTLQNCYFEDNAGGPVMRIQDVRRPAGGVIIRNGSFVGNGAPDVSGGALLVESSDAVEIESCRFIGNLGKLGGAISAGASILEIASSVFEENEAGYGGSVAARDSQLIIEDIACARSVAGVDGGFLDARENSSITISLSAIYSCTAETNGGALSLDQSSLSASQMNVSNSWSGGNGGALSAVRGSYIACTSCAFRINRAERVGGALSIISSETQRVNHQLLNCNFTRNRASFGGALHHLAENQLDDSTHVALAGASMKENKARVGGAVFLSNPSSLRYTCSSGFRPGGLLDESDLQGFSTLEAHASCDRWRRNKADEFGNLTATPARQVKAYVDCSEGVAGSVECSKAEEYEAWNSDHLVLSEHRSGDALPPFRFELFDAFGQGPASGSDDATVEIAMSSSDGLFSTFSQPFEYGTVSIGPIDVFVAPGTYKVNITFTEAALPSLTMEVTVRECRIGEYTNTRKKSCVSCGSQEYNFQPLNSSCLPCPEDADCSSHNIIDAKSGYWHSSPCSPYIHRCLRKEACDFTGRREKTNSLTANQVSCPLHENINEAYQQALCKKGYRDVLCGSCDEGYGHLRSYRCSACRENYISVLIYASCLLWLVLLTGFAVRSEIRSLTTIKSVGSDPQGASASESAMEMAALPRTETPPIENNVAEQSMDSKERLHRAEIAKELFVELFKITVNFLQIIAIAVAIEVNWTNTLISVYSTSSNSSTLTDRRTDNCGVDFLGGAGIESAYFPLHCLVAFGARMRSVFHVVMFFTMPLTVLLIFALFWVTMSFRSGRGRPYLLNRILMSALIVGYFSYESVAKTALSVVHCVKAVGSTDGSDTSTSYWAEDTALKCHEGAHIIIEATLAYPVIILFSVGFPVGMATALKYYDVDPDSLRELNGEAASGFVYRAYKKEFVYWEAVVMLRKLLLVVIASFGHQLEGTAQGILAVCVLGISVHSHAIIRPFREDFDSLNDFEGVSLLFSQLTFASGLVLSSSRVRDTAAADLLTVIVCVMVAGLMVFFISQLLSSWVLYKRIVLGLEEAGEATWLGPFKFLYYYSRRRLNERYFTMRESVRSQRPPVESTTGPVHVVTRLRETL